MRKFHHAVAVAILSRPVMWTSCCLQPRSAKKEAITHTQPRVKLVANLAGASTSIGSITKRASERKKSPAAMNTAKYVHCFWEGKKVLLVELWILDRPLVPAEVTMFNTEEPALSAILLVLAKSEFAFDSKSPPPPPLCAVE